MQEDAKPAQAASRLTRDSAEILPSCGPLAFFESSGKNSGSQDRFALQSRESDCLWLVLCPAETKRRRYATSSTPARSILVFRAP
jgi:hypothetical protein